MRMKNILPAALLAMACCACSTSKAVVAHQGGQSKVEASKQKHNDKEQLAFVQKVSDNALYQKNIVARVTMSIQAGDNHITVPGQVRLRKDQVIRLQFLAPILGIEVARMELTPDYVLIIDRLHKEYVKADYNKVAFLRDNGLNFYSLQALFWNQLFMPGKERVGEAALEDYSVRDSAQLQCKAVQLSRDKMSYQWLADGQTGIIKEADIAYSSKEHGTSSMKWTYSDFKPLGSKQYPYAQNIVVSTTATQKKREAQLNISVSEVNTSDSWEAQTAVPEKYTPMDVEDILAKITKL